MKIKRIRLNSFGLLSGEYVFPQDKCILIVEENEAGKSTLVDAILAGLYGFPDTPLQKIKTAIGVEDRLMMNLRNTYLPWQHPERYSIELTITLNGRDITIHRDFSGAKAPIVRDEQTGKDCSGEYRLKSKDTVGQKLLGMEWWDFKRSFLVRQDDINSVRDARGLTELVQRAASSQEGETTAARAIEKLRIALERYSYQNTKIKIETALKRINEELTTLENEKQQFDNRRQQIDEQYRELEDIEQKQQEYAFELKRLEYLAYLAEVDELETLLHKDSEHREQLAELKKELSVLEQYASFPAHQLNNLLNWQGELNSLRESIEKQEQHLKADIVQPLATVEDKLTAFKKFSLLTKSDMDTLKELSVEFKTRWRELDEKRKAYRSEEELLRAEGINIRDFGKLQEKFTVLSDEERKFVGGLKEEILARENHLASLDRQMSDVQQIIARIDEKRSQQKKSGNILTGIGIVVGIIGAVLFAAVGSAMGIAGFLAAVILIVLGILRITSAYSVDADKRSEATFQLSTLEQNHQTVERELKNLEEKATGTAQRIGFDSSRMLSEQFKHYSELQRKLTGLHNLERDIKERENAVATDAGRIKDWLRKIDVRLDVVSITPDVVESNLRECGNYFTLIDERDNFLKRQRADVEKIEGTKKEHQQKEKMIQALLSDSGIQNVTVIEEGVERFKDAANKHKRWHELSDELVPRTEKLILKPAELEEKKEQLQKLQDELTALAAAHAELKTLQADKPKGTYYEQIRKITASARSLSDKRTELIVGIGHFLEQYQQRYPQVLEEIERYRRRQQKAERFQKSVTLAIETLERISQEVYMRWADILNERANELLPYLNLNYTAMKFSEDLTFTIGVKGNGQRLDNQQVAQYLSRGAQDQIYLAVRIAISEYLSSAVGALPMIFDEPFANTDDERFMNAMKFLAGELSRRHQIIILTCHRQRHEWLRERIPELFNERIEVVKLVTLSHLDQ